jgi:hypothetical protein
VDLDALRNLSGDQLTGIRGGAGLVLLARSAPACGRDRHGWVQNAPIETDVTPR